MAEDYGRWPGDWPGGTWRDNVETWTIIRLEIVGAAKRAEVRHRLASGGTVQRSYGWPVGITRAEIEKVLDAEHAKILADPVPAKGYDETLDLVGFTREVEG